MLHRKTYRSHVHRNLLLCAGAVTDKAGQNQLLLRSCHGNIQNAKLFSECIPCDLGGHRLLPERLSAAPKLRHHKADAKPCVGIGNQISPHIARERMPCTKTADEADRILQSFALMDGCQTHNICIFIQNICFPVVHVVFMHLIDITKKAKQSGIISLFKGLRLHEQGMEIGRSSCSRWECPDIILVSRAADQLTDQLMDRSGCHLLPVPGEPRKKLPAVLPENRRNLHGGSTSCLFRSRISCCREHAVVQEPVFPRILLLVLIVLPGIEAPQASDFIQRKAAKISAEHTVQRDILPWIVDDAQRLQDRTHLLRCKIPSLVLQVQRNSLLLKDLTEGILLAGGRSKQDHNIAESGRAKLSCLLVRDRKDSHNFPDSLRHRKGLLARGREHGNLFLRLVLSSILRMKISGTRIPRVKIPGVGSPEIGISCIAGCSVHQKKLRLIHILRPRVMRADL